jgi:hypothetical protein
LELKPLLCLTDIHRAKARCFYAKAIHEHAQKHESPPLSAGFSLYFYLSSLDEIVGQICSAIFTLECVG